MSIVLLLMASPQYGNAHMVPSYKRHFARPTAYPPLVQGVTIEAPETLMAPFRSMFPANGTVCAACGCGDNTIGQWTRWCIVPLLVAWSLAQPGNSWVTLNDIAVTSRRTATICTLVIAAFRRLLRQEGAFVHQVRGEPKSVAWWCDSLIEATCQDATKELGVPLMHPRTHRMHCLLHSQLIDTVRVLPTEITTMHLPPVVNISLQNGRAGDRLGVIAVNSIHSAVFREMSYTPSERPKNVNLEYLHCQCGEYHIHVTLTEHVMSGDILTPCSFGPPKIFCQFDGSAHRTKRVGGAGAAMYVLSEQGLQLLDWSCFGLFQGARITLLLRYWVLISPYGCMKDTSIGASPTILSHSHWTAFKETSSPCSVTYASKLGSADQISLRLLIGFMRREAVLLPIVSY